MSAYGIDTSVFVRLLTGLPEADYQTTVKKLTAIRSEQSQPLVVTNIVIAEAYAVVQHHYGVSKADARAALRSVLTSGLVEPAAGQAALDAIDSPQEPGLTDRLILLDHARLDLTLLTHDRKLATQSGARRL